MDANTGAPQTATLAPLAVSARSLSRALRILQALIDEALQRGYGVAIGGVGPRDGAGHGCIVVRGHSYPLSVREKQGALQVFLPGPYSGRRHWTDSRRVSLENKLGAVLEEIEERAEEAEARRIEREREEAQRQLAWERAMERARGQLVENHRVEVLRRRIEDWHVAHEIRAYCQALEGALAATADNADAGVRSWLALAKAYADSIDPLRERAGMPEDPELTAEAMRPYLDGWSPYGLRGWG